MSVLCLLLVPVFAIFTDEGMHVSADVMEDNIKAKIQELVKQEVFNSYVKLVQDIIQNAITQQNLQLPTQLAYLAVQKAVVEGFRVPTIQKVIQEAYKQAVDQALDLNEKNTATDIIQQRIHDTADQTLYPVVNQPVFRQIIEAMLKEALMQQKQAVVQQAMGQEIQKIAIEQEIKKREAEQLYIQALIQNAAAAAAIGR